jgi:ATP-dependent helicase HrpA
LPIFLRAIKLRLTKLNLSPDKDRRNTEELKHFQQLSEKALGKKADNSAALLQFNWLLEEYRIALFAQELKTSVPVSTKRLLEFLQKQMG